ncbi:hypothetical protein RFN57_00385 [Streptomyces violaceochromogenes]|uniref:Enoyl-CoA hydratase n=1 Tax=Streptomyces violaceochromogenes TaxID=67377 RepID=A0ABU6LN51_9ACTN|nr:hypothetical protein [Streptomyces violaceochromogenes]MEC7050787.1 hypothetical protein [Streptomyces violaceochromogenes]GHC84754.1 hypothetical protein GCM10010309_62660 [Streptomyces violaceochromogenes]
MTGAPGELVLAEHRGPVLVLTFNRPARLNAWTDELEDRYVTLLDAAEDHPDVRAGVVESVASHLKKRLPDFPSLPVRSSDVPV